MRRVTMIKPWITAKDVRDRITLTEFDFVNVPWIETIGHYPVAELVRFKTGADTDPENVKLIMDASNKARKALKT